MLCTSPVPTVGPTGPVMVGCGQCFNCRINKRREWTARVLLEGMAAEKHGGQVSWCTLTYAEDKVPIAARGMGGVVNVQRTLRKADYQRVFKLLRKKDRLGPFRFALVGEYGERSTKRPHFHTLIYGPSTELVNWHLQAEWAKEYGFAEALPWRLGKSLDPKQVATTHLSRAKYIAGYVVKKMNSPSALKAEDARIPEFFQSSQSPPLGYSKVLLDLCTSEGGAMKIAEDGDVPHTIRIEGKTWPIGNTLRAALREDLGIPQTAKERRDIGLVPTVEKPRPTAEDYHRARQMSSKLQRRQTKSPYGRL